MSIYAYNIKDMVAIAQSYARLINWDGAEPTVAQLEHLVANLENPEIVSSRTGVFRVERDPDSGVLEVSFIVCLGWLTEDGL